MNYDIGSRTHYFNVVGNEWPTLLVEMAQWMLETNACIEGITFFERIEDPEPYVAATVVYSGKYVKQLADPFGDNDGEMALLDGLRELVLSYGK